MTFRQAHMTILIMFLLVMTTPIQLHAQTTWFVDNDAPNDPGPGDPLVSDPLEDGTASHPFDAIQEGIGAAADGDTVLVIDGTYTGVGNRDMSFLGKAITVRSDNGPDNCIIDCFVSEDETTWGFEFVSGEGLDSVLEGLTIMRAGCPPYHPDPHTHGIYIDGASPTIRGNRITQCTDYSAVRCSGSDAHIIGNTIDNNEGQVGVGISVGEGAPLIMGNTIIDNVGDSPVRATGGGIHIGYTATNVIIVNNLIAGNVADLGGGIHVIEYLEGHDVQPVIEGNRILDNHARWDGGGVYLRECEPAGFANNLIAGNTTDGMGGGIYGYNLDTEHLEAVMTNCTLAGNTAAEGGGLHIRAFTPETSALTLRNCVLAGNQAPAAANLKLGGYAGSVTATCDHCLIEDATNTVGLGHQTLIQASPLIMGDPLFTAGPDGDYCLSQVAAGQAADSPALDAGSDLAANICTSGGDETVCLDTLTTRSDGASDSGTVDLGYHYTSIWKTVSAALTCAPAIGTLPFACRFTVTLTNNYADQVRRLQHQVDVTLAGGQFYSSWRRGWQNVMAGGTHEKSWWQNIPALGTLAGENSFQLTAFDVTPAPYNQPPYPPAGDIDNACCTVTGVAP